MAQNCNAPLQPRENWTPEEVQRDYDYFMAQKTAGQLLKDKLISLSEFDKLTQINRETFYPHLVELMPKIA